MHAYPTASFRQLALAALAGALLGPPAMAQDNEPGNVPEAPNFERWQCRQCEFDYGWTGSILFGAGYVSEDFAEFGNFRDQEEEGVEPELDLDLIWRDDKGRWLDILGADLGRENRELFIQGGKQGSYRAWIGFDGIQHFRADDTASIFTGAGNANQRLPAGWVRGGRSDQFETLAESLRPVDIKRERNLIQAGFELARLEPWTMRFDVSHEIRDGNRIQGGSFIFSAIELASPVEYETTRIDAAIGYSGSNWELETGYNLSLFENDNRSLTFENPFFGINGADIGQLAQPPDNQFHQFSVSGSWRPLRQLTLAGQVAFGRIEQDDNFVSPSLNPMFGQVGLPIADLDGEVDTAALRFRASSPLTRKLRATLEFAYDERDNDSDRASFAQVVSDTFLAAERINEPFSYEKTTFEAGLDYRVFSFLKLDASARFTDTERTFQEVEDTDTEKYRLRARINPIDRLNLIAEASYEERDNDLDPALLPRRENPALRRFHFAEKERDAYRLTADYALTERVVIGAYGEISDDDYTDTRIGLSSGETETWGVDLSATLAKSVSAHAFWSYENLEATIFGADDVIGAPWTAKQDDRFNTVGLGLRFADLPGRWLEARIDAIYARSEGDIRTFKRDTSPLFPELETDRYEIETSIERELAARWNLRMSWLVGRLTEDDFFRDLVQPATLPNLLSLGEGTPGDTVHVISAMLRYRFQ